jgi:hypothetical protein
MLDVRITAYVVPVAEQVLDDITPVIRIQNFADEDATITGLIRVYRKSTDTLEFTSELTTTLLAHGTQANIAALSAWSPGAPADDDYFILAEILATSDQPGPPIRATLGAWTFDIKPGPMGPAPASHHTTHENGGMDEVDLTGLSGLLSDAQTPTNHVTTHQDGGADPLDVDGLPGELADDQPALPHGNARHLVAFEDSANRGIAGGFPTLPTPLDASLVICADNIPRHTPTGTQITTDAQYYSTAALPPWYCTALASGTLSATAGTNEHPGIVSIISSTSTNSGYRITHGAGNVYLLAGGENTKCWFRPQTLPGTTLRFGLHDATSITAPVDGAYVLMDPATARLSGRTMANSASSVTGTDYQLVTNTWYCAKIIVNTDATRVDFYLYDDAGALLWTDNLTTNIPTATGREVGHGIVATNSGTTAVTLADVDLIQLYIPDRRPEI